MLHDLTNDDGSVALKRTEEDRRMHIQGKDVKKLLYVQRKIAYDDDDVTFFFPFHLAGLMTDRPRHCFSI